MGSSSESDVAYSCNVAFTIPVNTGYVRGDKDHLSPDELWTGIKHGARHPNDFASYIEKCEILSGTSHEFVRRLTVGDGAVHTKKGVTLDQEVVLAEGLSIEATTIGAGAKTTILMTRDAGVNSNDDSDLYFTASYELKVPGVQPGTERAEEVRKEYTELARKACRDGVNSVRGWKREDKLKIWKAEDERLGR